MVHTDKMTADIELTFLLIAKNLGQNRDDNYGHNGDAVGHEAQRLAKIAETENPKGNHFGFWRSATNHHFIFIFYMHRHMYSRSEKTQSVPRYGALIHVSILPFLIKNFIFLFKFCVLNRGHGYCRLHCQHRISDAEKDSR